MSSKNSQALQDGQVDQDDLFVPEKKKKMKLSVRDTARYVYKVFVISSKTGTQREELNDNLQKKTQLFSKRNVHDLWDLCKWLL